VGFLRKLPQASLPVRQLSQPVMAANSLGPCRRRYLPLQRLIVPAPQSRLRKLAADRVTDMVMELPQVDDADRGRLIFLLLRGFEFLALCIIVVG
jgi:hypothetical protein